MSLHFSDHFPGGPVLAGARMLPFWILLKQDDGCANCHHQQTNIQFFYRMDALPVTQPTMSIVKALKGRLENHALQVLPNLKLYFMSGLGLL